ncbi:MAG: hypothetical protein EBU39_04335, partial [Proteobacteria bacterium]|nr:hypothetical protein [Pseudomonadota bacterium]
IPPDNCKPAPSLTVIPELTPKAFALRATIVPVLICTAPAKLLPLPDKVKTEVLVSLVRAPPLFVVKIFPDKV